MAEELRLGVLGLGDAGTKAFPYALATEGVQLAAVADVRPKARELFAQHHPDVPVFDSLDGMCAGDLVDAVWVGTPSEYHAQHAIAAMDRGKHVVCEKPMALMLEDCDRMIDAVERNGVKLINHSHSSDPPIRKMREIIASGQLGRLIGINTWNYKGWINAIRRPDEFDTSRGGGIVFRQAPHQIEIVRCIGGGRVRSVRAVAGRWNPRVDTEGNVTTFLQFEDGTPATMVLNCYGYFNMTDLTWGIGEGGAVGSRMTEPGARQRGGRERTQARIADLDERYAMYDARANWKGTLRQPEKEPFYGLTLVSCEQGDMRQSPDGVYIYTDDGMEEVKCSPYLDRGAELSQLRDAVFEDKPIFADQFWGRASVEVILAILQSSRENREVTLSHQHPTPF